MKWLKRLSASDPTEHKQDPAVEEPIDWTTRRRPPLACAGCKMVKPPYVYMENDKDYCVECALTVLEVLRLHPAGKRTTDIKLADLIRDHTSLMERVQKAWRAEGYQPPGIFPPAGKSPEHAPEVHS